MNTGTAAGIPTVAGGGNPLAGRLMALADVYDALVSRRTYKQQFSHEDALEIIRKNSGSQFDPDVVAAFVASSDEFSRIAHEFADDAGVCPPETEEAQRDKRCWNPAE